ncbi:MAG: methyltransferase domain-containing protein [Gammaproteobacteria bacterium]|nr:methyltransferase domain-containing protein [Gammaproteobacteria bacterium]
MAETNTPVDWDERYRAAPAVAVAAARVLVENRHLLPASGAALDLACGLGGNALLLAAAGLETHAWDSSPVAIEKLHELARERGLRVDAEVRDVVRDPPQANRFDVIVVSRFLERDLAPRLIEALRPGGLLYYQTHARVRVDDRGPRNDAYRLADGELLALFAPLQLVVYREEGRIGRLDQGLRNEALLVARKRDT